MADTTIQKQGEVFISQSEYDALRLAGNLQSNTKYHITKDPNNLTKSNADTLYVPKSTFTDPWQVIMSSDPKTELTAIDVRNIPSNHALAQYDTSGRLQTSNPDGTYPSTDAERYVANVGYADAHYVAKGTTPKAVYTRDSQGNESMIAYTENATAWTIAQRAAGGVLRVGTPVGVNDATPKAYVDGLHHYSHHVKLDLIPASAGGSSTASICMTVASKNTPNAVTSLNDIAVTTSLAYLLYYLGAETEGWEFSSTGYIKHNDIMYLVYDLYVDVDYKINASCINLSTMAQANLVLTNINEQWQVNDFIA